MTDEGKTKLFAYLESSPKYAPKQPIRLSEECRWMEESWSSSRTMGESKSRPYQMFKTGPVPKNLSHNPYDVRAVPLDGVNQLRYYDEQIAQLTRDRAAYLKDNFRLWPLVKQEDCERVFPGTPKSEIVAKLKGEKPRSKEAVTAEAKMASNINRAIGDTLAGR